MEQAFVRFMKAMDFDEFNVIRDSELGETLSYINIVHLYIISHYERITVSELADRLNLSRPAVTQKINELEKLGMVVKTQSNRDKRVVYITLADEVMSTCREPKMATVVSAVASHFSNEKLEIFEEILNFMADYVEGV